MHRGAGDGACRMANLETDVPQHVQHLLDHLFDIRMVGRTTARRIVQEHDVDVGIGTKFATTIAANRQERNRHARLGMRLAIVFMRSLEHVAQDNVHELRPTLGGFASPCAGLVQHPQAMFFDLEKLLINVQDFGRTGPGLQDKPLFGMPQYLIQIALLGHGAHHTGRNTRRQGEMPPLQVFRHQRATNSPFCNPLSVDRRLLWAIVTAQFFSHEEGAKMTLRHRKQNPLADILRSQQEEIKKYKWIESEKLGKDIGWEKASQEWLHKHFP